MRGSIDNLLLKSLIEQRMKVNKPYNFKGLPLVKLAGFLYRIFYLSLKSLPKKTIDATTLLYIFNFCTLDRFCYLHGRSKYGEKKKAIDPR